MHFVPMKLYYITSSIMNLIGSYLQVICEFCNNCRDVDLCRDAYISYDESSSRWVSKFSSKFHTTRHL